MTFYSPAHFSLIFSHTKKPFHSFVTYRPLSHFSTLNWHNSLIHIDNEMEFNIFISTHAEFVQNASPAGYGKRKERTSLMHQWGCLLCFIQMASLGNKYLFEKAADRRWHIQVVSFSSWLWLPRPHHNWVESQFKYILPNLQKESNAWFYYDLHWQKTLHSDGEPPKNVALGQYNNKNCLF